MTEQLPHILVVDDEQEIRQMVALCLEKSGCRISCAQDAVEAYALMEQETCDVIVTDVMMPGEDGIKFLARVHERWPDVPVIIMTGYAQLQMAVNAIKNGAFDFVHKPFDFGYLRKIVERAIRHSRLINMEKNYRVELERALAQRSDELKSAMLELEYARTAMIKAATDKSEFLANLSHEMRTPMNGVIGALDLLAEEPIADSAQGYLAIARQSADRMVNLVDEMLSFGAYRAGTANATHNNLIDIQSYLGTLLTTYRPKFSAKGLTFDLTIQPGLPQHIWTDQEQLSKLIDIVVGNALKFTEQGGCLVTVFRSVGTDNEDILNVVVSDSGVGIPDGMLERIFEPFVQGDGSLTRRYEGVGLGLSIARQIAQLLNGTIHAEHGEPCGSRFCIALKMITP